MWHSYTTFPFCVTFEIVRNRAFVYSLGIGSLHGNSIENIVIKLLYWCLLTTICSARTC